MANPDRPGLNWTLDTLWHISGQHIPRNLDPSVHFNTSSAAKLAFRLGWGMDTNDYLASMGFVNGVRIDTPSEDKRCIILSGMSSADMPPQLGFQLQHDGLGVRGCEVFAVPEVRRLNSELPPQYRIGAISLAVLAAEAAGTPMANLEQLANVYSVRDLGLAAGAVLLNAAAMS